MKKWTLAAVTVAFFSSLGLALCQQPAAPAISLFEVNGVDVSVVLKSIFSMEKLAYEVSADVQGPITLKVHNASLKEVLRSITKQVHASYRWQEGKCIISLAASPQTVGHDTSDQTTLEGQLDPDSDLPHVLDPYSTQSRSRADFGSVKRRAAGPRSQSSPSNAAANTGGDGTAPPPPPRAPSRHVRQRASSTTANPDTATPATSNDQANPTQPDFEGAPQSSPGTTDNTPVLIAPGEVNPAPDEPTMYVGREDNFRCWVRFNPAPKPSAASKTEDIPTTVATKMYVQLWADPGVFAIDPAGPVEISVPKPDSPVPYFDYVWHVRPLTVGSHPITLNTWIDTGGPTPDLIENRPYTKVVTVVFPDSFQYYAGKYWQWPTGTISFSALGGLIASRRKSIKSLLAAKKKQEPTA